MSMLPEEAGVVLKTRSEVWQVPQLTWDSYHCVNTRPVVKHSSTGYKSHSVGKHTDRATGDLRNLADLKLAIVAKLLTVNSSFSLLENFYIF